MKPARVDQVIALSGPLCAGKSTLAACLRQHRGVEVITAREILATHGGDPNDRRDLQRRGADLERTTKGRWLLDGVVDRLATASSVIQVVDSIRTTRQARLFRAHFTDVFLLHLTAAETILRERFLASAEGVVAGEAEIDRVFRHEVERDADSVRAFADAVIDTSGKAVADVCAEALAAIRWT
jgi:adenylosuccinate synthase